MIFSNFTGSDCFMLFAPSQTVHRFDNRSISSTYRRQSIINLNETLLNHITLGTSELDMTAATP